MKYLTLVKKSFDKSETPSKEELSLINTNAELSTRQTSINLEKKINNLKSEIASEKSNSYDFDAGVIINKMISLKVAEEKFAMLKSLEKELF